MNRRLPVGDTKRCPRPGLGELIPLLSVGPGTAVSGDRIAGIRPPCQCELRGEGHTPWVFLTLAPVGAGGNTRRSCAAPVGYKTAPLPCATFTTESHGRCSQNRRWNNTIHAVRGGGGGGVVPAPQGEHLRQHRVSSLCAPGTRQAAGPPMKRQ